MPWKRGRERAAHHLLTKGWCKDNSAVNRSAAAEIFGGAMCGASGGGWWIIWACSEANARSWSIDSSLPPQHAEMSSTPPMSTPVSDVILKHDRLQLLKVAQHGIICCRGQLLSPRSDLFAEMCSRAYSTKMLRSWSAFYCMICGDTTLHKLAFNDLLDFVSC